MNTLRLLDTIWQDLRYGCRLLVRNPTFSIVAILTLALGTGANAAIFQLRELGAAADAAGRAAGGAGLDRHRHQRHRPDRTLHEPPAVLHGTALAGDPGRAAGLLQLFAWGIDQLEPRDRRRVPPGAGPVRQRRLLRRPWRQRPGRPRHRARPTIRRDAARRAPCCRTGSGSRAMAASPSVIGQTITLDGHAFEVIGVTGPQFFGA